jgi:hypothetical protein
VSHRRPKINACGSIAMGLADQLADVRASVLHATDRSAVLEAAAAPAHAGHAAQIRACDVVAGL